MKNILTLFCAILAITFAGCDDCDENSTPSAAADAAVESEGQTSDAGGDVSEEVSETEEAEEAESEETPSEEPVEGETAEEEPTEEEATEEEPVEETTEEATEEGEEEATE